MASAGATVVAEAHAPPELSLGRAPGGSSAGSAAKSHPRLPSYFTFDASEAGYEKQVRAKVGTVAELFAGVFKPASCSTGDVRDDGDFVQGMRTFRSPPSHYRVRARFGLMPKSSVAEAACGAADEAPALCRADGGTVSVPSVDGAPGAEATGGTAAHAGPGAGAAAAAGAGLGAGAGTCEAGSGTIANYDAHVPARVASTTALEPLSWGMLDQGKRVWLDDGFPVATRRICDAMPHVAELVGGDPVLRAGIAGCTFLSTHASWADGGGDVVTLLYGRLPDGSVKVFDDAWVASARALRKQLATRMVERWPSPRNTEQEARGDVGTDSPVHVVGRATGTVTMVDTDTVVETFALRDGRRLRYRKTEGVFSNPNPVVCVASMEWLCSHCRAIRASLPAEPATDGGAGTAADGAGSAAPPATQRRLRLLELFCGNGNHTVALAGACSYLVAVEISGRLVDLCVQNLRLNGFAARRAERDLDWGGGAQRPSRRRRGGDPAKVAAARAARAARATRAAAAAAAAATTSKADGDDSGGSRGAAAGTAPHPDAGVGDAAMRAVVVQSPAERVCRRVTKTAAANFDVLVVDPPRCGLDANTLRVAREFSHILYISCNPEALRKDVEALAATHELQDLVFFDHFP